MKEGDKYYRKFQITDRIYNGFQDLFEDKNPLHTSHDFASKSGFKGKVMYGNILNGFLSYFVGECLPVKNVMIQSQSIKYHNPVYLGDSLDFQAEISYVAESVNAIEFKFNFSKKTQLVGSGKIIVGII